MATLPGCEKTLLPLTPRACVEGLPSLPRPSEPSPPSRSPRAQPLAHTPEVALGQGLASRSPAAKVHIAACSRRPPGTILWALSSWGAAGAFRPSRGAEDSTALSQRFLSARL